MALKKSKEYFLGRIKEYYITNGRVPGANNFNGKFRDNIILHFGSWQNAVKLATGQQIRCAFLSDEEIFLQIRNFIKEHPHLPSKSDLPKYKQMVKRFGSYNGAILAASGIDIEKSLLNSIRRLTLNTDMASLGEIIDELKSAKVILKKDHLAYLLRALGKRNLIKATRGDRIKLYSLEFEGRKLCQ